MPTFRLFGGFTGEESLVHDGSVGAHLIQASAHVHRGGGAVKLLPSAVDLICTQVGGDFLPGGGGFAGNVLSLQSFWHHSQLSSFYLVVFVSFHSPQVATNLSLGTA